MLLLGGAVIGTCRVTCTSRARITLCLLTHVLHGLYTHTQQPLRSPLPDLVCVVLMPANSHTCTGYNSRMALYVLDEFLNSFGGGRIKLATVGFGTNDAAVKTGK